MAISTDACWGGGGHCQTTHFCVEPCILLSNQAFLCRTSVIMNINSAVYINVSGQWPTWWCSPIGQWAVTPGRHVLIMVSEQGTNKPLGTTKSFTKSQNSMACILSFVVGIQRKTSHDIDKSVFVIIRKFGSDTTSPFSAVTKKKYAILQWTNKDPATIFTSMRERHLWKCPDV